MESGVDRTRMKSITMNQQGILALRQEGSPMTQYRLPITWDPLKPGLNLSYSGLEAGHYSTGVPKHGWVLRSRDGTGSWNDRTKPIHPPYAVGDRLFVRETSAHIWTGPARDWHTVYKADGPPNDMPAGERIRWDAPSRMPQKRTRFILEIQCVYISRAAALSPDSSRRCGTGDWPWPTCKEIYGTWWDQRYGQGAFARNGWVWAIDFRQVEGQKPG
jgi:hypothetical protein